jgi:glutaminyl-peptide cyclotransferase
MSRRKRRSPAVKPHPTAPEHESAPTRPAGPRAALLVGLVAAVGLLAGWGFLAASQGRDDEAPVSTLRLEDIPFNGQRAYEHLKELCAIGPRPSGSPGMAKQQELLAEHFRKLGGQVEFQRFRVRHPLDGSPVELVNLIVRWHPESKERILLGTHYDTLPYPLLDKDDPRGTFVGANDGASGVAVLMELGREIPKIKCRYGIDFVFFDAEEFVFRPDGRHFLGSEYFARDYVNDRDRPFRYRWGVILDMVGDKDLQIYQERHSAWWKDTRPLVDEIWQVAARLGVREFIPRRKHQILDDHIPLHDIAGISCILLIDYDYPYWHTQADTPDKCSALSLAKVGWVVLEWLKQVK